MSRVAVFEPCRKHDVAIARFFFVQLKHDLGFSAERRRSAGVRPRSGDAVPEANGFSQKGGNHMRKMILTALGAATMFVAAPAPAQEVPLVPGDYWEITEIDILDGQFSAYADYLADRWRRNQEFGKSKGWIKDYMVFGTVNARADEPDLYLVAVYERQPSAAEQMAREKEFDAFMKTDSRREDAAFAGRATMRKVGGSMLLQRLRFRR